MDVSVDLCPKGGTKCPCTEKQPSDLWNHLHLHKSLAQDVQDILSGQCLLWLQTTETSERPRLSFWTLTHRTLAALAVRLLARPLSSSPHFYQSSRTFSSQVFLQISSYSVRTELWAAEDSVDADATVSYTMFVLFSYKFWKKKKTTQSPEFSFSIIYQQ